MAQQVQAVTGKSVEVAFVDQGYTGPQAEQEAAAHGIRKGSRCRKSDEALCCCRAAGWSNAAWLG
jgi:hypothetical protein